jgi:hypothetical protein
LKGTNVNIYQKLNEARQRFHATELKKSGRNTFANYNYFELGDFLIPALAVFKEVGLCALPITFKDGQATMTIVDVDKPEDRITFESPMGSAALKGCHEVQNIGAVETYQRRYLWVSALEIVEHDALEAVTGSEAGKPEKKVIPASFRASPTMGALDALEPKEREYVESIADRINELGRSNRWTECVELVRSENMDNELKIGLWAILDSKTRAAFKKAEQALREAQAA